MPPPPLVTAVLLVAVRAWLGVGWFAKGSRGSDVPAPAFTSASNDQRWSAGYLYNLSRKGTSKAFPGLAKPSSPATPAVADETVPGTRAEVQTAQEGGLHAQYWLTSTQASWGGDLAGFSGVLHFNPGRLLADCSSSVTTWLYLAFVETGYFPINISEDCDAWASI